MGKYGERAQRLFEEGYNCAQAVAGAFAEDVGMDLETITQLISGFGGGFGRMREVCGAFSGLTLIASIKHGYHDPKDSEEKNVSNDPGLRGAFPRGKRFSYLQRID